MLKIKQTIKNLLSGKVSYSTPSALWVLNSDGSVDMIVRKNYTNFRTTTLRYPAGHRYAIRTQKLGGLVHVERKGRGPYVSRKANVSQRSDLGQGQVSSTSLTQD